MTRRLHAVPGGNADDELGHRTCGRCGGSWWTLAEENGAPAQVMVDHDGEIVGWTGALACGACGATMDARPLLEQVDEL